MHYCFLTFGSWYGNAGLIRPRHLGAALIERGHQVSYVVDDVPFNHELKLHPAAHVEFVASPRSMMQLVGRRRAIKQLRPDYIHLLNAHAKSYAALVGTKIKIVAEWDEPPTLKNLGFARNRLEEFVDRWLRKRASVRVACTSFLREHFREKYGMAMVYIPHAPYLERHDDGVSPFSEPTAVYMGNLFSLWDHDVLFEAARILKARGISPSILLMGDGPDMPRWKAFASEHGLSNVQLPGFMRGDELWLRLRHAHVLLFPIRDTVINRSRCPSKVFAYAQACRPIITSRVGELPYMLGDDRPIWIAPTAEALADELSAKMSLARMPDVDYRLEGHSWAERADRLLRTIGQ